MNGYIYAIRLTSGLIKFGYSSMIRERVLALRRQYGPDIELLAATWGMQGHETALLQLLRPFRVKGELFRPVPVVLHAISMMGPFPEVTPVSKALRAKFKPRIVPRVYDTLPCDVEPSEAAS